MNSKRSQTTEQVCLKIIHQLQNVFQQTTSQPITIRLIIIHRNFQLTILTHEKTYENERMCKSSLNIPNNVKILSVEILYEKQPARIRTLTTIRMWRIKAHVEPKHRSRNETENKLLVTNKNKHSSDGSSTADQTLHKLIDSWHNLYPHQKYSITQ